MIVGRLGEQMNRRSQSAQTDAPLSAYNEDMARALLVVWFTFTSLLGPGVCCCALRAASPATASTAEQTETKRSCCGAVPGQRLNDEGGPCPGCPHKDQCPCKRDRSVAEALPPSVSQTAFDAVASCMLDRLDPVTLSETRITIASRLNLATHAPPGQFHSTDDLLYVFHILRC